LGRKIIVEEKKEQEQVLGGMDLMLWPGGRIAVDLENGWVVCALSALFASIKHAEISQLIMMPRFVKSVALTHERPGGWRRGLLYSVTAKAALHYITMGSQSRKKPTFDFSGFLAC
jgi:hypothetical protein